MTYSEAVNVMYNDMNQAQQEAVERTLRQPGGPGGGYQQNLACARFIWAVNQHI